MFTEEQIKAAELKVNSGADFPRFIAEIKALGVVRNDVYVLNGLSIYFDGHEHAVQLSPEQYPTLIINETSSKEKLEHALKIHQAGETDYFTFCKQAADAGVEKWVTDLIKGSVSYLDMKGNELVKEFILGHKDS